LNGGQGLVNSGTGGGFEPGWSAGDDSNIAPTNANLTCGSNTWTNMAGMRENLPINCENWYEAYAFCIWDGGFLPSDAEWGYAAAGGSQQREYPWGSTTPGTVCPGTGCEYAIYNCDYPSGTSETCTGVTNIAPVGTATRGAGLWGQLDMAGEVYEWNLDRYNFYTDPCTNCADTTASDRVIRGGDFEGPASNLLPGVRHNGISPTTRTAGFRCARSP
jgi:formylglycine-generating enzyme required for sulfatase activity